MALDITGLTFTNKCRIGFYMSNYGGNWAVPTGWPSAIKNTGSVDYVDLLSSTNVYVNNVSQGTKTVNEVINVESSVTLNTNGGTCTELTKYREGSTVTLPIPTKDNCTFDGWYTTSDFSGTAVTEIAATETGDKVYYAKWADASYAEAIAPTDTETYPQIQGGVDKSAGTLRFIWEFKFHGEPTINNFGAYIIPFKLFNDYKDSKSVIVSYTGVTPADGETFSADITNIPSEQLGTQISAVPFVNDVFGTQIYTTTVN